MNKLLITQASFNTGAFNNITAEIMSFQGSNKHLVFTVGFFNSDKVLVFKKDYLLPAYEIEINPIAQACDYLKSLDEFKDAEVLK